MRAIAAAVDQSQWPEPDDCGVCIALDVERLEAYDESDWPTVAQCNAEILNHPHLRRRSGA
ncbi:hypothetical protein ADK55_00465 [Streptomyces sp. WM4235]|uniref:hypothetical protein n=1 Tax=Streptomyces sp. WM4235 TaxID=1415551 RepID=UPI0006AE344A|nr:hypothetical protein [Streptomyces sp. WM4235]KOU68348.1 hypothetical protein ADK55_00465 [Streptomyces sp. WM4235]